MTTSSALLGATLFLICLHGAFSFSKGYDSVILQLLSSKYTMFVKLLDEANVLTEIEQEGHLAKGITVLAPSDVYLMEKVSPSLLSFLSQPQNVGFLRKILKNHIAYTKAGEAHWYDGAVLDSLSGEKIELTVDGDALRAGSVAVKELNVLESTDGVVHTVHGLLIPEDVRVAMAAAQDSGDRRRSLVDIPSIVRVASAPAPAPPVDLTTLVSNALEAAGNYGTMLNLLTPILLPNITQLVENGQYVTIAAPDDTAFVLLSSLKLNESQIADVLMYHVFMGAYDFDQLAAIGNGSDSVSTARRLLASDPDALQTLSNLTVTVETTNSPGLQNVTFGGQSSIILPDILDGSQGISIQGVGALLVPPGLIMPPPPMTSPVTYGTPPPPPPPPASAASKGTVMHGIMLLITLLGFFMV